MAKHVLKQVRALLQALWYFIQDIAFLINLYRPWNDYTLCLKDVDPWNHVPVIIKFPCDVSYDDICDYVESVCDKHRFMPEEDLGERIDAFIENKVFTVVLGSFETEGAHDEDEGHDAEASEGYEMYERLQDAVAEKFAFVCCLFRYLVMYMPWNDHTLAIADKDDEHKLVYLRCSREDGYEEIRKRFDELCRETGFIPPEDIETRLRLFARRRLFTVIEGRYGKSAEEADRRM